MNVRRYDRQTEPCKPSLIHSGTSFAVCGGSSGRRFCLVVFEFIRFRHSLDLAARQDPLRFLPHLKDVHITSRRRGHLPRSTQDATRRSVHTNTKEAIFMSGPFNESIEKYEEQGFNGVFPLKYREKSPLPVSPGFHGHMGFVRQFNKDDYLSAPYSVGLRASFEDSYLVCIDVDNGLRKRITPDGVEWVEKIGGAAWAKALEERGALPFAFKQTSRDPADVGGHYFVRVPYGWKLRPIGHHVDIKDYFTGYVLGAPSYNDNSDSLVRFYDLPALDEIDIPHAENDTYFINPDEDPAWLVQDETYVRDYRLPCCAKCVDAWHEATGLEFTGEYSQKTPVEAPRSPSEGTVGYKTAFGSFPPTTLVEWYTKFLEECDADNTNQPMLEFQLGVLNLDPDEGHETRFALRKAKALYVSLAHQGDRGEAEKHWNYALERARHKVEDRKTPEPSPKTDRNEGPISFDDFLLMPEEPPFRPTIGRRQDGQCLFYSEAINVLYGQPSSGKSMAAQDIALQVLADGGTVLYLDFESAMKRVLGRFKQFGLKRTDGRLTYKRITEKPEGAAWWTEIFAKKYDMIIIDGISTALTYWGLTNSNDNHEVAAWYDRVPETMAQATGAAVVLIDHTQKSPGDKPTALGAGQKEAKISGAAYFAYKKGTISAGYAGTIHLRLTKDKEGSGIAEVGKDACRIQMDFTQEQMTYLIGNPYMGTSLSGTTLPDAKNHFAEDVLGKYEGGFNQS